MAKAQRKVVDGGIDLERTRERLVAYLLSQELDLARVPPEPDRSLPAAERQEAEWNRADALASVHMDLHGVPARIRGANGHWEELPRCMLKKCKVGGASFALYELCAYWRDHERRDLESNIAELLSHVASVDAALLSRIDELTSARVENDSKQVRQLVARARELERQGDLEPAAVVLSAAANGARILAPRRLVSDRSKAAVSGLRAVEVRLRTVLSMIRPRRGTGHVRGPQRRGGRPKQDLRKALLLHLKSGGFTYAAMNNLVVGASAARGSAEIRNQLHQATLGRDARTVHP